MGNCPSGKVEQAGLCYNTCPSGYNGVSPMFLQTCLSDFIDIGIPCQNLRM